MLKETRYYASVNELSACPSPLREETQENQGLFSTENSRVTLYTNPVIRNFSEDGRRKALREHSSNGPPLASNTRGNGVGGGS